MNNTVYDYTKAESMPPDPCPNGDLTVCRVNGTSCYLVVPFTHKGYDFLVANHTAGIVDGDSLRISPRDFRGFMNVLLDSVLDEGLKVV